MQNVMSMPPVAADRMDVAHRITEEAVTHKYTICKATAQLRYLRIENGPKASDMMPVFSSPTGGYGPFCRVTPCAVAHPQKGIGMVISACDGNLNRTTIAATGRDSNV